MTLLSKQILPITLMLAGGIALSACSSKPSPWSESSSPWDARSEQAAEPEPMAIEDITPVQEEAIEPVGYVAAEDRSAFAEGQSSIEEPPVDEPVIEEPMIDEAMPEGQSVIVGESLSAQPAGMFAVQVVASSSMEQLNFFVSQNQLSDEWTAETVVEGKTWFVLMSGVYATKGEAEQALAGLQELGTDPWIRTVGSVQAVMPQ